jgi:dienelactone hydrolase
MKKHLYFGIVLFLLSLNVLAQVEIVKIIDEGGSGTFKALAKSEVSIPDFVVYRPEDIKSAVKKEGKLPVIVWANGGCMNSSIHHERLLTEVASHGYVIIAIGKLQMSVQERVHQQTPEDEMLKALDWISNQVNSPNSEYFKSVDLKKIAAAGQSCGGAQTFRIASDKRIKTYLIFNAGMGNMTMAGASAASLKNLHRPILYLIGGESDVAYANAVLDYEKINHVPVAFANHQTAGHGGTFSEKFGGSFAKMALDWLDWQLKSKKTSDVFLKSNLSQYPDWTMMIKNF